MYTVIHLSIEFVTWHVVETVKKVSTFSMTSTQAVTTVNVSYQLIIHHTIQFVVSSYCCSRHRWSHDHITRDWRSRNERPSLVDDCDRDLPTRRLPDPSSELVSFYGVLRPSRTSSYVGHCDGRLGQPREGAQAFDAVLIVRNSMKAFLHCGSPRLEQQRSRVMFSCD